MGQKTNPISMRLNILNTWDSRWFCDGDYKDWLLRDIKMRSYLIKKFKHAGVSKVIIERVDGHVKVNLHVSKPGVIIGKQGAEIEGVRKEVYAFLGLAPEVDVDVNVVEIKRIDLDARLVAQSIADQIQARRDYRKAMKRAAQSAMKSGAAGVKIICAGRLAGAEIARSEGLKDGRVPLHTLRSDIDFARATAFTTYGTCGVKVWICRGEVKSVFEDNKKKVRGAVIK